MKSFNKEDVLRGIPLNFEKNSGHLESDIKYSMRTKKYNILFYDNQILLCLIKDSNTKINELKELSYVQKIKNKIFSKNRTKDNSLQVANILRINLNNNTSQSKICGQEETNANISYRKGNNENDWIENIKSYKKVEYTNIYEYIDMICYEKDKKLSYDFIVKPKANLKDIKLTIEGNANIKLNKDGDLEIEIDQSKITMKKPISYQTINDEKVYVKSEYLLSGNNISFKVEGYDKNIELVIDPTITYETYLGGSDEDNSNSIAVDKDFNIYITGRTYSIDFPLKNPLETYNLSSNIFVSKINKYGNLVFSTYLGGSDIDEAISIAVDDENSIYITGITKSDDFPMKNQIYNYSSGIDCFVCKIRIKKGDITKEEIGELVFSSYLGGFNDDYSNTIYVDKDKYVYIAGCTNSSDFPLKNEIGNTIGNDDIFISKIKINEGYGEDSELLFSTTLGGDLGCAKSIVVDENKNIYVAGYASTSSFPLKYDLDTFNGSKNMYLIKIDPNDSLDKIKFATYIREYSDYEEASSIKVDGDKNIYISGYMIDTVTNNRHIVIYKIGSNNNLLLSKKIAGDNNEEATDIEIDEYKNIYITGYTTSTDFPLKNQLFNYNNNKDAFVLKMESNGNIIFSTYLGGSNDDISNSITLDKNQCIYVTGNSDSDDFSNKIGLESYMGYGDIFVSKIEQARYLKIGDTELISKISKDRISLNTAQSLTCYINSYEVEQFYITEEIKKVEVDLSETCQNLIGLSDYKEISIKPYISFSIALFKNDYCLENSRIYALEEGYVSGKAYFGCISMDGELPNSNDFEVLINASYEVVDEIDDFYIFDISVSVGLLYRGDL